MPSKEEVKAQDRKPIIDLRVFVVGGGFQYIQMFEQAGFKGARSVDDADIVCFTGGEDVSPELYDEKPLKFTNFNKRRDDHEMEIYLDAFKLDKPMVGICRGGQFLNVMNNGKLWQHVNNHAVAGGHEVTDVRSGEVISNMTSTHHQQMIAAPGAEVIAVASLSTEKESDKIMQTDAKPRENDDMEVLWYPKTLCLCFQPHPEFGKGNCRDFFLDLLDEYIIPAT